MVYLIGGIGGMAYFVYGKRQQNAAFLVTGVCLCIYPYVVSNTAALILIGLVLLSAPFFLGRQ
jgi:hypothetical protein